VIAEKPKNNLALACWAAGRTDEAIKLREAAGRMVRLYEGWDKPDQAAAWKAKLGMSDLPADVFVRP
jgi:hypothetical protein